MRILLRFVVVLASVAASPIAPAQIAGELSPELKQVEQAPAAAPSPPQQRAPDRVPKRFESPRATMFTFLDAMNSGDTKRAVDCFDIPATARDAADEIVARLYNVLNRIGRISPHQLPGDAASTDRLDTYTFYPSDDPRLDPLLELAPRAVIEFDRTSDGSWKFSRRTFDGASDFFRRVESLPVRFGHESMTVPMRIRSSFPAALRRGEFLGVEYWQWLGLLALLFVSVVADFALRLALAGGARAFIAHRKGRVEPGSIRAFVRPFGLLGGAALALLLIWTLGLPPVAMLVLMPTLRFILAVAGVWSAMRLTDLVSEHLQSKAAHTHTRVDDLLIPLLRKSAKTFIFAIGLIYIAHSLSIQILPLLTGLGIGGLAVAFAAKDTIENFFGSLAVIVDHPFGVGDWIVVDGAEGTVEDIGFRSTRIRTFYNSVITVPNATLVRAKVDNYGRRRYRRLKTHISLAYDTNPDTIEAFCEGVRELIRAHPYTRKDYYHVWLHEMGDSSLNVLLYMFLETPDWQTELRERQRILLDIIRLANKLQVEFAFPTRTIHLRQDDGRLPDPAPAPKTTAERSAIHTGRQAADEVTANAAWRKQTPPPFTFSVDTELTQPGESE